MRTWPFPENKQRVLLRDINKKMCMTWKQVAYICFALKMMLDLCVINLKPNKYAFNILKCRSTCMYLIYKSKNSTNKKNPKNIKSSEKQLTLKEFKSRLNVWQILIKANATFRGLNRTSRKHLLFHTCCLHEWFFPLSRLLLHGAQNFQPTD